MKRTIYLHGYLGELHPEPVSVEAETVAEAIRSLSQLESLQQPSGEPHHVTIKGIDSDIALFGPSDLAELHVYPRLAGGGGNNGLTQVLIGITMVAVAWAFPALGTAMVSNLYLSGGLMILGGLLQLLAPVPDKNDTDSRTNRYLGASVNTTKIGTRIPRVLGTRRVGGHVLSFDVDAVELASANSGAQLSTGYFVHDQTTYSFGRCPVNPVYASATPGSNPISQWNP